MLPSLMPARPCLLGPCALQRFGCCFSFVPTCVGLQEHAVISAALGLKPGAGGLGRTFTPETNILQELQLVEERIAGRFWAWVGGEEAIDGEGGVQGGGCKGAGSRLV